MKPVGATGSPQTRQRTGRTSQFVGGGTKGWRQPCRGALECVQADSTALSRTRLEPSTLHLHTQTHSLPDTLQTTQ